MPLAMIRKRTRGSGARWRACCWSTGMARTGTSGTCRRGAFPTTWRARASTSSTWTCGGTVGRGTSGRGGRLTWTDFVREDVPAAIEEIRRISGPRPVYPIGHSLGGLVSYATAPTMGDAVGGIVTLGSPYLFTHGSRSLALLGRLMLTVDRRVPLGQGALPLSAWGEPFRFVRAFVESPIFPLPIRGFVPGSMETRVLTQHMSLAMDSGSITVLRNMFLDAAASRKSGHHMGASSATPSASSTSICRSWSSRARTTTSRRRASVKPAYDFSRSSDKTYRAFPRGHLDIVVGRDAPLTVWPLIEAWLKTRIRRAAARERDQLSA